MRCHIRGPARRRVRSITRTVEAPVAEPSSEKPVRTDIDAPISREDAATASSGPHGYTIPGRDFAGTSRASDQNEQTADHRGESREQLMDDTVSGPVDQGRGLGPRDES